MPRLQTNCLMASQTCLYYRRLCLCALGPPGSPSPPPPPSSSNLFRVNNGCTGRREQCIPDVGRRRSSPFIAVRRTPASTCTTLSVCTSHYNRRRITRVRRGYDCTTVYTTACLSVCLGPRSQRALRLPFGICLGIRGEGREGGKGIEKEREGKEGGE